MAKYLQRNQARAFRKDGMSIRKIAKKLDVSRASASIWCRDIILTKEQIKKLALDNLKGGYVGRMKGAMINKQRRLNIIKKYEIEGVKEVGKLSRRELFFLGLGLYAGEGEKYGKRVGISNSDPKIILLIIKWLHEICGVSIKDIKCQVGINRIHLYRISVVEKYWSDVTKIPLANFMKSSIKKVENKKVYENMNTHFGTLYLRIRKSSDLEYKILGWLHGVLDRPSLH